ncbi:MAG: T9SS type A sorting domain-containing protein [Arcticibacter sp.]
MFAHEKSALWFSSDRSFWDQVHETGITPPKVSSASSPLYNVRFLGPHNASSRTRAIVNDKSNPAVLFAGSTTGGLWKSVNQGQNWSAVDDFSTGMNITCLEQNPLNPDVLYYGTGEFKNRKIRDSGSGIYRSTDHGNTFTQLAATANPIFWFVYDISHSPLHDSTLYVATALNGVYRSNDSGQSFQSVFNNGKTVSDVKCMPNGEILLAVSYDGIYISASGDSGTFIKATGTPTSGFSRIETAYCDSFPNILYAVFSDSLQSMSSGLQGMYKSTDGGQSWSVITNPDNVGFFPYADYMLSIAVKPDNPNFVVVGGAQGCYTSNGGQSFIYLQYPNIDQHKYLFSANNPNVFYAGHDQGLTRFTISGSNMSHTDLIQGYHTVQVWGGGFFPYGDDVFIGSQDNKFKYNRGGSSSFQTLNNYGIDGKYCHIHPQQNQIAYALGDFGYVMRSDNFTGNTPTLNPKLNGLDADGDNMVDDETWYDCRLEMDYTNGDRLFLSTRDHIWKSDNRGDAWSRVTNSFAGGNSSPHPYAMELVDNPSQTLYVGGTKGLLLRINNVFASAPGMETDLSNSTPQVLVPSGRIQDLKAHPTHVGELYAGIRDPNTSPRIWRITGADGLNPQWNDISGNLSSEIHVYSLELDPTHPDSVIFAGTEYGLWYTTDGGNSWSRDQNIPPVTIYDIRVRQTDRRLFVFTFGRGVWMADLDSVTSVFADGGLSNSIQVYPNPSEGVFHLNGPAFSGAEPYWVSVCDAFGREVFRLEQSTVLDLKNLSAGMYVVKTYFGKTQYINRIIKTD